MPPARGERPRNARAALAVHQHRHIGRGHQPDVFVQLPRGVAAPLDVVERRGRSPFRRTRSRFGRRGLRLRSVQRLAYLFQQFVGIHRLGHVVAGAEFHAPHGVLNLGVTRHHDHRHRHARPGHPLQQGDAVLVGQTHVAQHQRESAGAEGRAGRRRGGCGLDSETAFRKPCAQHQGKGDVVVYDQNTLFHNATKLPFFRLPRQSRGFFRPPRAIHRTACRSGALRGSRPGAGCRRLPPHRAS